MPAAAAPAIIGAVPVRDEVRRLAGRGGDLTEVRSALDRVLRRAVGYDVAAISTIDPATKLWTSCYVSGVPADGARDRERILFDIEFRGDDVSSYAAIADAAVPVGRLHAATGGDISRAIRYAPLLEPFGIVDEMRVVLRARGACWGSITLYRAQPAAPFSSEDEALVASAVTEMADLMRLTLLRAALAAPQAIEGPPGLLLVGADGEVTVTSEAATSWLDAIDDRGRIPSAVRSVVAAAAAHGTARAALPARNGRWVVLHGSPVTGGEGTVSVIVEGARPAVLSEVIAGAYGFTAREREVTALASQGRSTKHIAATLGISPFTAQDHLKAIYAKAGVQSRGELVAAIFASHYEPRWDAGSTPGPYGWYLDEDRSAG